MAREELIIDVKADIGDADKDLTKVRNKVDDLDGATQGAGKSAGGFFGGIGGGVAKLGLMATGIGAVVNVGGELVGFFKDAVGAAAEEQVGIDRLNQSLKNNVPGWDGNTSAIEDYIAKQEQLAFADDELRDSLNWLVTQTGDLTSAQNLQATAMDLARSKGIDLQTATKLVGKVDAENIGILKRYGITVDENATKEEALSAIRAAAGGQAEQYANSMQGSMDRVGNAFDNAKETIGGAIMTGIQPLLSGLANFVSGPEFMGFIQGAMSTIGGIFSGIGTVIGAVWGFISATVLPVAQAIFAELSKWWTEMQPALTEAWAAIQSAVEAAWNFIGPLLTQGMAALQTLWNAVWPGIQATFEGVWTAVQGVLQVGWAVIEGIWNTVTSILRGDWEGAWNAIKTMFEGVWKGVETFLSGVWATIKGIWETATAYLGQLWETAWTGIQNFFTGVWNFITNDLPKKLGEIWAAITGWITTTAASLGTEIGKFVTSFWTWITTTISGLPGKLAEIWTTITTWVTTTATNIVNTVKSIGTGIIDGIKNGISGAWDSFVNWIGEQLAGFVQGIKDFFGIKSPSRLIADEIGKPMAQGLRVGFEEEMATTNAGLQDAGASMPDFIASGWSGGFPNLRSTMIGDIDLLVGEVRKRAEQIQQMMENAQATGSAVGSQHGSWEGGWTPPGNPGGGGGGGIGVLDSGGIVSGPRLAALAMDGRPEAVIPLDRLDRMMATRPVAVTTAAGYGPIDIKIENRDGALMPQTVRVISRALQLDRTLTVTGARS
jgi:phage-related protein